MTGFIFVAGLHPGVFVVRLKHRNEVDHAVVVDTRTMVIIDSEESTAIERSPGNVAMCEGPEGTKLRVEQIREID